MESKVVVILVAICCVSVMCESCEDGYIVENITEVYYKGERVNKLGCVCKENMCIRKCCSLGYVYNPSERTCENSTKEFNPVLYDKYLRRQSDKASDWFHFVIKKPDCDIKDVHFQISMFAEQTQGDYHLRTDGMLYVEGQHKISSKILISPVKYCIDTFVRDNEDGTKTTQLDALVCAPEDEKTSNFLLSSTCMLISCVFILATVAVYLWLPQLHNIHGRVLVAYLLCLFVAFIFLATMQLMLHNDNATEISCVVMSFIIYFSLLSAFFWLNVMCFDIWSVFNGKRELRLEKLFIRSKLRAYACYAFGFPTLLTIILASLEFSGLPLSPWLPLLRFHACFLSEESRLIYLYGPILILCIINIVFFVLTAIKIMKTKRDTSVLKSGDSSRHDQHSKDKQRLILYVKLFIVMGVNWILEVASALYPSKHWRYADAYNVLIGLIIFIIFVCKRKTIKLLKDRIKEKFQRTRTRNPRNILPVAFIDIKHRESQETIRSNTGDISANNGDSENDRRPNLTRNFVKLKCVPYKI